MYSATKNFLDLLGASGGEIIQFSPDDTRTAIAVLYYRVIVVDGRIRNVELEHFRRVLSETLEVTEDELMLFEETVLSHINSERSLQPFTDIVRKLPLETREDILKHMHQISISDRELHEFEINLVARTAELLGIENDRQEDPDEIGLPPKSKGN